MFSWVQFKEFIEILYLLSGPFIAFFAFLALSQIRISKRNSEDQCRRDALLQTANQAIFFAEKLLPDMSNLNKEMAKLKVPQSTQWIDFQKPISTSFMNEWLAKARPIQAKVFNTLNRLEAYALFFTQKIAYEDKAFDCMGNSFCEIVNDLAPMIILLRKDDPESYKYIVQLYELWCPRAQPTDKDEEIEDIIEVALIKEEKKNSNLPVGTGNK